MPDTLRALTLWQPWAWAIFHGKPVENRTWPCPPWQLGRPLAIHGGKRYGPEAERFCCEMLGLKSLPPEAHAQGVLGIVVPERNLSLCAEHVERGGCEFCTTAETCGIARDPVGQTRWFSGPVGWVLRDPIELSEPVPCRGAQGLWKLPPDVLAEVERRLGAAREGGR